MKKIKLNPNTFTSWLFILTILSIAIFITICTVMLSLTVFAITAVIILSILVILAPILIYDYYFGKGKFVKITITENDKEYSYKEYKALKNK